MSIPFFTPTSGSFYQKIQEVPSFDEKVNLCIENVSEFCSVIKKFHELRGCPLVCCVVGLFSDGLYNYIQKRGRRSPHLLKKNFVGLCKKYPQGFESFFKIVKSYQGFVSAS